MKKLALLSALLFFSAYYAHSQENQTWETPMHTVKFMANGSEEATLKVDPGFNYADLSHNQRNFRLLFQYSTGFIKHARIIDQDSKLQVARGRGSYFWEMQDLNLSMEKYSK